MSTANVKCSVRKVNASVSIIDIQGEINAFAEEELMSAYHQATQDGARTILLNFKGLDYMNSSGIGLLVTLLIRAKRQNQRLLACNLNEHYQQIFELTRLNEAITLFPTEEEALAGVLS
jgi:anti-sigma B factor antagonist